MPSRRTLLPAVQQLLFQTVLALGALVGWIQTYAVPLRRNRGPEGRWWERIRRLVADVAESLDTRAGPRPITEGEYAGCLPRSLESTEEFLYRSGFVRNPTARLKVRDGRPEDGSWVYRESPLATRQLHLMLWARPDGSTDIYAHEELSSVHPLCGVAHFTGLGQSVGAGVRRTREWFPVDTSEAPDEPPEGAWND